MNPLIVSDKLEKNEHLQVCRTPDNTWDVTAKSVTSMTDFCAQAS